MWISLWWLISDVELYGFLGTNYGSRVQSLLTISLVSTIIVGIAHILLSIYFDNVSAGSRRYNYTGIKHEITIAKNIVCLIVLWMISWTPYAIVALLGISGNQNLLSPGNYKFMFKHVYLFIQFLHTYTFTVFYLQYNICSLSNCIII